MSPFGSGTQWLEDGFIIPDEMLQNMMPDPDLQSIESFMQMDTERDSYFASGGTKINTNVPGGDAASALQPRNAHRCTLANPVFYRLPQLRFTTLTHRTNTGECHLAIPSPKNRPVGLGEAILSAPNVLGTAWPIVGAYPTGCPELSKHA